MRYLQESDTEFHILYQKLMELSEQCEDKEEGKTDKNSPIYKCYDLQTVNGKRFYRQLKDRQLLDILRKTAIRLDHSPSQKEVFWVWREYIRKRFQKWPYALEAAGLKKASGAGARSLIEIEQEKESYRILLKEVRKRAEHLCRIPHPQDIPELCSQLKKYQKDWKDVIRDAGIDQDFFQRNSLQKIENLEPEYVAALEEILNLSKTLGRSPMKSEVETEKKEKLVARCGSWRNMLYQIGLEPVVRMNPFPSTQIGKTEGKKERLHRKELYDCYYRVLNPDIQTRKDLEELYRLQKLRNRLPHKKEISPELRKRLQNSCGSWANALYQLRYLSDEKERNGIK